MESRKTGTYGFSKAGCYFFLFVAILGGVFSVISLFIKSDNIARHDLLTLTPFALCIAGFIAFYVVITKFEDPEKMVLDFHPPKATHRDEILRICEEICKYHSKTLKPVAFFVFPPSLGLICFGIAKAVLDSDYFFYNMKTIFTNTFLLPTFLLGIAIFFVWEMIYKNRIDEIRNGDYAVAEVSLVEKYYCVHTSQRAHYSDYFVILEDSHGNKGRFKVSESSYYTFYTGSNILLVKRRQGKLFYNAMEPVAIREPERFSPDM